MEYQNIIWEKEDNIGVITLNRPKALNALSRDLLAELENLLDVINKDPNIGAFIITGAHRPDGRPCFSAGADLKRTSTETRSAEQILFDTLFAMTTRKNATGLAGSTGVFDDLCQIPKISIAAVDGVCTAGGLELALGCDIIIASETAQISDLHVKNLGLIGGAASTTRLARRVGVSKAIELACTCDAIDGREAYRIHFANQVYAPDKLMEGAKAMAKKIASMRPIALAMAKATCKAVYDMDYNMAYRYTDACSMAIHFGEQQWREKKEKEMGESKFKSPSK
jgi:enoyl-CoA hydratase/carnithine racemase